MPILKSLISEGTGSGLLGAGAQVAADVAVPVFMNMGGGGGGSPKTGMPARGWHRESYRHSLAARGVSTTYRIGGGSECVPETPNELVKAEVIESTKIPPGWSISRCGYTGDKLENDSFLYEVWSVIFKSDRSGEEVRYFYIVKSKRTGKDTYCNPEVVERFNDYNHAMTWLGKTRQGKITRGERP
jgi:hypothetical protein